MAKNTIADLDTTASNNTDVLNQSTQGTAAVSTIDTMIQNSLGLLARFYADLGGLGTVGGTADAITLTTASTYQALESGLTLSFKAGSAITGASTINVDGLGVKAIRRIGDSATQAGDIVANGVYLLRYDAAYNSAAGAWILLNAAGASAATTSAAGIVELSTDAEAQALADTARAVTPSNIAALVATQANQETATAVDRFVSPGRQQFHPSAVKGWVYSDMAGSINSSYNVASVTDVGAANFIVNWATDMSGTAFVSIGGVHTIETGADTMLVVVEQLAGSTEVRSFSGGVTGESNITGFFVIALGDQS